MEHDYNSCNIIFIIGAINATAHNVTIQSHSEDPPKTLKDLLSPRVGDKIYQTDNKFQQEWLTGIGLHVNVRFSHSAE